MLADAVGRRARAGLPRTWVVGIVGPPGCGKSTLAGQLRQAVGLERSLCVSLDDFYLTPAQRQSRGLSWRGGPGTHDLALLDRFVTELRSGRSPLSVPVYARDIEQRLPPNLVPAPVELCIIEGWFVGAGAPGYEGLQRELDELIYLDMGLAEARAARLSREARLRSTGQGGMSESEVIRFWDEALVPHLEGLVLPLRERADVVVSLDGAHQIVALRGPGLLPPPGEAGSPR